MFATARFPLVLLMVAAATATACRHDRCPAAGPTMTFVHPNGLTLTLPEELDAPGYWLAQRPAGFVLLSSLLGRSGMQLTIELRPGAVPPGAFPKARVVNGTLTHYRTDKIENPGSGGDEYELDAWQAADGGHIFYVEHETAGDWYAWTDPSFCFGWAGIEGTKRSP